MARDHLPALVILDVNLPDISGTDVLRLLKDQPATRDIPVVMLTADATRRHGRATAMRLALRHLTKPVRVSQLLGLIDTTLDANGQAGSAAEENPVLHVAQLGEDAARP